MTHHPPPLPSLGGGRGRAFCIPDSQRGDGRTGVLSCRLLYNSVHKVPFANADDLHCYWLLKQGEDGRHYVSQELEDIKPVLDIKIEEDDPLSTPLSTVQQSDFVGVPCGLMDADTTIRHEHLNFMHKRNKDEDHRDLWKASEQKKKREQNKLAQPMKTDKRHRKMPRGGSHEDSDNLISVVRDQYNEYGLQIAKTLRDIKNPVTFRRVVNRINKTLLDAVAGRCSKSSPENGVRSMNGSKASTDFPKVILPPVCKDEEEELSDAVDPLGGYSPDQPNSVRLPS
ncbi:uncharacterized protein LOC135198670 isoform X2 [Macrobrachium nipponense]|uniref:uncharacterized protein LOC135198670 isoform X2 n=1 Tax=Macrobrachium nipponense TaxID=159736 RepID=UPI0030C84A1A